MAQNYVGKEQTIVVDGKSYKLSRLTRATMKEFAEWAKSLIPNPLDVVAERLDQFAKYPHLQEVMVKDAVARSKTFGDFNSPEVQSIMSSMDGQIKMVSMLLKPNHPELTEDEVFDIALKYQEEHGEDFRSPDDPQI